MATLYPKYISPYSNTAMRLGTGGMQCKSIHSDDALEIEKCYFFGGYSGHKGARGVNKRTFRVYTGPKSAYYVLRQHEASLRSWIADEENRMSNLWASMKNDGKPDPNRMYPLAWGMGNDRSERIRHKERAARYAGYSYRRKEAKKALELQKSLNDALGSGAGLSTGFTLAPMLIQPTLGVQRDVGRRPSSVSPDYLPWRGQKIPDDIVGEFDHLEVDESDLTDDWVMPSADEIPTWMWAVGGAGAAFVLYRMMKK